MQGGIRTVITIMKVKYLWIKESFAANLLSARNSQYHWPAWQHFAWEAITIVYQDRLEQVTEAKLFIRQMPAEGIHIEDSFAQTEVGSFRSAVHMQYKFAPHLSIGEYAAPA